MTSHTSAANESFSLFAKKRVCIVGVGYVGEHLVDVFSKVFQVHGYDISPKRVAEMTQRFVDRPNVMIQSTSQGLEECNIFCISVPTLLKAENTIDSSYVEAASAMVQNVARPGSVVVMESSVAVGMTRKLLGKLRETGLYVGFSPERVDPGRTQPSADKIPKIISGYDDESLEKVKEFYGEVFDTVVPVSSMETAEMCKLFENCFRMVNVAYVNEVSDACLRHDIKPLEMIQACATKPYGFMPFYPGLGVGGYCISINPSYLFVNNDLPLLKQATDMTRSRPLQKAKIFVEKHKDARNVLVIGAGFKPGQSVLVNSPSLDFANGLRAFGRNVWVHDPLVEYCPGLTMLSTKDFTPDELTRRFDKVVIGMKQVQVDYDVLSKLSKDMVIDAYVV